MKRFRAFCLPYRDAWHVLLLESLGRLALTPTSTWANLCRVCDCRRWELSSFGWGGMDSMDAGSWLVRTTLHICLYGATSALLGVLAVLRIKQTAQYVTPYQKVGVRSSLNDLQVALCIRTHSRVGARPILRRRQWCSVDGAEPPACHFEFLASSACSSGNAKLPFRKVAFMFASLRPPPPVPDPLPPKLMYLSIYPLTRPIPRCCTRAFPPPYETRPTAAPPPAYTRNQRQHAVHHR